MQKALLAALCIASIALMLQVHTQSVAIKRLQQAALAPTVPSLELQEKCAKQAAVEARQEGLDSANDEFTNHYSAKLGRCFVITSRHSITGKITSVHKLLVDAYEGKVYGNYEWMNLDGKPFWQVSPSDCTVTQPAGEEKNALRARNGTPSRRCTPKLPKRLLQAALPLKFLRLRTRVLFYLGWSGECAIALQKFTIQPLARTAASLL